MATAIYYLRGTCKWAKVHTPDEKYGNYELDLFMDEDSWDLYNNSGLELKTRKDEEGNEYIRLRRPCQKLIKGELVDYGPPKVLLGGEETKELIGNGSEVTCKVQVYDTVKGKGHRLDEVTVHDLVEYNKVVEYGVNPNDEVPF